MLNLRVYWNTLERFRKRECLCYVDLMSPCKPAVKTLTLLPACIPTTCNACSGNSKPKKPKNATETVISVAAALFQVSGAGKPARLSAQHNQSWLSSQHNQLEHTSCSSKLQLGHNALLRVPSLKYYLLQRPEQEIKANGIAV